MENLKITVEEPGKAPRVFESDSAIVIAHSPDLGGCYAASWLRGSVTTSMEILFTIETAMVEILKKNPMLAAAFFRGDEIIKDRITIDISAIEKAQGGQ